MYLFDGYWEDIGTIRSFYNANLGLAADNSEFEIMKPEYPIYTRARFLPPTKMSGGTLTGSLLANGCFIGKGATIENSVIGLRTMLGPNVTIRDSIVMGCDYYDSDENSRRRKSSPMGIGEGTLIQGAIIDKNVCIGKNVKVVNESNREDTALDHPLCVIRDGIPIVVKNAVLPDGWDLEKEV